MRYIIGWREQFALRPRLAGLQLFRASCKEPEGVGAFSGLVERNIWVLFAPHKYNINYYKTIIEAIFTKRFS